jgi:DNA-binding MarR family transcriptional regulator
MEKLCKIRDIQRAIARFEACFENSYGICLNEGMALCSLAKADRLSSGELGELLGLTSSNTSKVINSIESKGLVARELGSGDKRRMFLQLTAKGRALLASVQYEETELCALAEALSNYEL